jgi:uncharacterized protein YjiS (DUF1127 family)
VHKSAVAQQSGASIACHPAALPASDGQAPGPAAASGLTAGAKRFADVVTRIGLRIASAIAVELRVRRDMRHLTAMSDHMLKDIGLRRADISHAVRYGRD